MIMPNFFYQILHIFLTFCALFSVSFCVPISFNDSLNSKKSINIKFSRGAFIQYQIRAFGFAFPVIVGFFDFHCD